MLKLAATLALVASIALADDDEHRDYREFVTKSKYKQPVEGENYCYALALSGGGAFGDYETGVLWGLVNYGDPTDFQWDVLTGVSAGSINAGVMSVWPKGKEVEMMDTVSWVFTNPTGYVGV